MKRLFFVCATIGLMLGSAALPPAPRVQASAASLQSAPAAPIPELVSKAVVAAAPAPPPRTPAPVPAAAAHPAIAPEPPPAAAPGAVRVLVSLPQQRLWVFRGSELIATSPVSTGKRGHETPAGTFPILQKRVEHYSNLYDNAPMPYMQRLTHSGIALHGGRVPGYRASHGCIRLPHLFARRLYGLTNFNTRVVVTRARPGSTSEALNLTL
jgi:lipoprotein-anchoring transpeptidase ErfK/SrfK